MSREIFEGLKRERLELKDFEKGLTLFKEILELEEEYEKSTLNRLEFSRYIKRKINELSNFSHHLEMDMQSMNNDYSKMGYYISDYKKLLNILVRLANKDEEKYAVKELHNSVDSNYGDVTLLGSKNVIENSDCLNSFEEDDLSSWVNRMIDDKESLIVVSDHYMEFNYKPYNMNEREVDSFNLLIDREPVGSLTCYLFDGDLKDAVYSYLRFARDNGADIKGIDDDVLYKIILSNEKSRKLVK